MIYIIMGVPVLGLMLCLIGLMLGDFDKRKSKKTKRAKEKLYEFSRHYEYGSLLGYDIRWKNITIYIQETIYQVYLWQDIKRLKEDMNELEKHTEIFKEMQFTLDTIFTHLKYISENNERQIVNEFKKNAELIHNIADKIYEQNAELVKEKNEKKNKIVQQYQVEYDKTFESLKEFWNKSL